MTAQALSVEPIRSTVVVQRPLDGTFALLTDGIASWWPFGTHSYGGEDVETAVFEGRIGGRVYERRRDGAEQDWAEVLAWEPPRRFVLGWKIFEPTTEVEVRLEPEGAATRVELEHRGWENVPPEVAAQRERYGTGWDAVLARFVDAANV